jgi:hypothetical protein
MRIWLVKVMPRPSQHDAARSAKGGYGSVARPNPRPAADGPLPMLTAVAVWRAGALVLCAPPRDGLR